MRASELLRLVALNINQNKFKTVMTSIGIVAGAATIVLVIGIGRGGQMDIAEQFAQLNAGAIDVSYDYAGEEAGGQGSGFSLGGIGEMFGNMFGGFFGGMSGRGGSTDGDSQSRNFSDGGAMPDAGSAGVEMPDAGSAGGENAGNFSGGRMQGGAADGEEAGNFQRGGSSDGEEAGNFQRGGAVDGEEAGNFQRGGSADGEEAGNFQRGGSADGENAGGFPDMGTQDGESPRNAGSGDTGNEDAAQGAAPGQDTEDAADSSVAESGEDDLGAADTETEPETSMVADRMNQEKIVLAQSDVEDIERYVQGITGVTISYSTNASIEGGNLTSAQTYTVAGVKESYEEVSRLVMSEGSFIMEEDDDAKSKVCVLGSTVAKELFGSGDEITGSTLYIDERAYTVVGVLEQTVTVASGISPDSTIFIPYETGIKYVTGEQISPVITVIAEDVDVLDSVIADVRTVLEENYVNAAFTFEDSGSKMEAAQSSNRTLTMLLSAMAVIVFLIGGIGIMNVLFVSVKERTGEIGILKAIGTPRTQILAEFLLESAAISSIGGILGVALSFGVIPVVEQFDVRIEVTVFACVSALGFAVLTGTVFGLYPAWKASKLEPVEALSAE